MPADDGSDDATDTTDATDATGCYRCYRPDEELLLVLVVLGELDLEDAADLVLALLLLSPSLLVLLR
jgi:hypothetical protein